MEEFYKKKTQKQLKQIDEIMIAELDAKSLKVADQTLVCCNENEYYFRNKDLAKIIGATNNLQKINDLEKCILDNGGFEFSSITKSWTDIDHEQAEVTILRASLIKRWPMGTHYWIRDNTLVANRLLNANLRDITATRTYNKLGKDLLLSALRIMSSKTQLQRFKEIALLAKSKDLPLPENWPHIFMAIENNLTAAITEPWQHIQDAWQMLLSLVFKAIKQKQIAEVELSEKMKTLIGLAPLFMKRIDVCNYESAGSWEEIAAKRSSVLVWEHALINDYLGADQAFVADCEKLATNYLGLKDYNLFEVVKELKILVEKELHQRLPYECPQYPKKSVRYREADAALLYVLQLDTLNQLTVNQQTIDTKANEWAIQQEQKILDQIEGLRDPITKCIKRYHHDVYQQAGFFRHYAVFKLSEHFGGVSADASEESSFKDRQKILPPGREAAWTHFLWQYSSWACRNYRKTGKANFLNLAKQNFMFGLSAFTGFNEHTLTQQEDGGVKVTALKPYLMPECYISDKNADGEDLIFPTPHTPLHWSIGEALDAFTAMYELK